MSDDNDTGDGLSIKREKTLIQKESLTIKSKRGSGTNDRDEVRKFVEREAELDVPDDGVSLPTLIDADDEAQAVAEVAGTMNELRATNNGDE